MGEQKDHTVIAPSANTQTTEPRIEAEATCDSTNIESHKGFLARSEDALDAVYEWVASRPAGQILFRSTDKVLRVIEKTLVWSTQPRKVDAHNVEGGVGLVLVSRPLAWPLFLPLLFVLRIVRTTLYVVTLGSADSEALISWLQCRRRRMRAIKFTGIRNMRTRRAQTCKWTWSPFSALGWFLGLTGGSAAAIEVQDELVLTPVITDKEKKRKYAEVETSDWSDHSDHSDYERKGNLVERLNHYVMGHYNSDSDPDFEPVSEEDSSDDERTFGEEEEELLQEETANVGPANGSVSGNGVIGASNEPMATDGEFEGSPVPMAAIPSERTSKVSRFFVPFKRKSSK